MKRHILLSLIAVMGLIALLVLGRRPGADEPEPDVVASAEPAQRTDAEGRTRLPAARTEPQRVEPLGLGDQPAVHQAARPEPTAGPAGAEGTSKPGTSEGGPEAGPTVWPSSAEGIAGAMREALPGIRRCYEQALEVDPSIAGRITVTFAIDTTDTASGVGQVTSASIQEATIEQETMDDCLLDAMEALQFDPPSDGAVEVTYPFSFSTG